MVYKYIRKTKQGSWTENDLQMAMFEYQNGTKILTAFEMYNIPFSTLYRHFKSRLVDKHLGRFRSTFSPEQENELVSYLKEMDSVLYGLSKSDFKSLVAVYAQKNNIDHPKSWDISGLAGDDWLAYFLKRNPNIVLRTPEPTSVARARGFNRPQVERFFKLLEEQYNICDSDTTRVYNMDETGISTTTNKPPKVFSITYWKKTSWSYFKC